MSLTDNPVFEETYAYYLDQISRLSLSDIAEDLGATLDSETLCVTLYGHPYRISNKGITGMDGERPSHEICVILSKYILRCPPKAPDQKEWVSFKDFKDAAPLINYFARDVEDAIADYFSGRLASLKRATEDLGGSVFPLQARYDHVRQFSALPKVPVALLFNDSDEEFKATGTVLFQRRTEVYLDAECIAMLGWRLYKELRLALKSNPMDTTIDSERHS